MNGCDHDPSSELGKFRWGRSTGVQAPTREPPTRICHQARSAPASGSSAARYPVEPPIELNRQGRRSGPDLFRWSSQCFGWIFSAAAGYLVLERIKPGWKLAAIRTWPLRATLINLAQLGVVPLAGATWESWFSESSVFQLSEHLSPLTGGLLAYLIATFVFYWWHRWRHESDILWRTLHQIHHSARRIELATSFYKHPLEMTINSVLGAALVYALLGLSPVGGAVYTACTALGEFFYHANLRTPRWVGWIFQRPEMHRIHHQYGRHRNNYGDLTCWDMLFGTYENPETVDVACGFDEDREERLLAMLAFRDVHAAPNG